MREQPGQTMQEESLPRFGNYDLVRRIDVGGMGEVYLAHQRSAFGRDVAIKIIRSDLVHDVTARSRFLRRFLPDVDIVSSFGAERAVASIQSLHAIAERTVRRGVDPNNRS